MGGQQWAQNWTEKPAVKGIECKRRVTTKLVATTDHIHWARAIKHHDACLGCRRKQPPSRPSPKGGKKEDKIRRHKSQS